MSSYTIPKSIPSWAEEDRPREKMILKGKLALSDAELIAILMGSGNRDQSAVELAKTILASIGNDLNNLAKSTIKDLMKFKGVGDAKAISIVAALELGRRRKETKSEERPKVGSSIDSYEILKPYLLDLPHEEFWILLLDRSSKLLRAQRISIGGISGTLADPKVIFKQALEYNASCLVLAHNHPSGNKQPSHDDRKLTKRLVSAGEVLDIKVLDHIIFTNETYYSLADNGEMT